MFLFITAVCTVKLLEGTYVYSSFVTAPLFVWLYVVISLAPRVVQSYLFSLSGFAARCFNLSRFAVRAVCYTFYGQREQTSLSAPSNA